MLLVRQVRKGVEGAIDELLQRYQARMRRIIAIKMGAGLRRHLDVDDVLQEVFLISFQKIDRLELHSKASILQWMAKIADNVLLSKVRYFSAQKRSVGKEVPIQELTSSGDDGCIQISDPGTTPPQGAVRNELQEMVDMRVERLEPANYREVILLRDYQEHDWEEIRVLLGQPTAAAAQELHRRAHLKLLEHLLKHLGRSR